MALTSTPAPPVGVVEFPAGAVRGAAVEVVIPVFDEEATLEASTRRLVA